MILFGLGNNEYIFFLALAPKPITQYESTLVAKKKETSKSSMKRYNILYILFFPEN